MSLTGYPGLNLGDLQKVSGDFPLILYEVIGKRSSVIEGSLSIDEINEILDTLCKEMGKQYVDGSRDRPWRPHSSTRREIQSKLLQRVYNKSTPTEQQWLAKIILKGNSIAYSSTPYVLILTQTCTSMSRRIQFSRYSTLMLMISSTLVRTSRRSRMNSGIRQDVSKKR